MDKLTVTLKFKDEKKWSIRFDAEDKDDAPVASLYISKSALGKAPWPKVIEVEVRDATA